MVLQSTSKADGFTSGGDTNDGALVPSYGLRDESKLTLLECGRRKAPVAKHEGKARKRERGLGVAVVAIDNGAQTAKFLAEADGARLAASRQERPHDGDRQQQEQAHTRPW